MPYAKIGSEVVLVCINDHAGQVRCRFEPDDAFSHAIEGVRDSRGSTMRKITEWYPEGAGETVTQHVCCVCGYTELYSDAGRLDR